MIPVFADTVGLIALWDESDQWHNDPVRAYSELSRRRTLIITTTFVLLECGNAASRRPYRVQVDILRERMERLGRLIWPSLEDWKTAWKVYGAGESHDAGIVDLVSFQVMRQMQVTRAFTNDRHFKLAGFETLI